MQCSGRRLRTKDDLHLLKYRADIEVYKIHTLYRSLFFIHSFLTPPPPLPPSLPQQWIQEQDAAFRQVEDASPHPNPPVKQKLWTAAKKVLVYLLE